MKKGNDLNFKKIRKVLEFVWNSSYSSFYRDKYKKAGIHLLKDVNSIEDFNKLPFLTKGEIVKSDPSERLFLPLYKLATIAISSGTTGGADSVSIVFKAGLSKTIHKMLLEQSRKLKDIRAMYLLPAIRANQYTFASTSGKLRIKGIRVSGDITNLPLSAKIAAKLKINVLRASPTALYFFTPHIKREYDLNQIKYLMLIGEYCSKQKATFLKNSFTKAKIICNYGIAENDGSVGNYCNFLDSLFTQYFHPNPELYIETIKQELIITNLIKNMFPLIRYKTGDAVRIENFNCKCGDFRRMKVLGRINYDSMKIHGSFIYAHLVDKALLSFSKYIEPTWQMHVYEETVSGQILPRLKLQLVLKGYYLHESEKIRLLMLIGISENLFLSAKKTLADLVKEFFFLPLEIEFVSAFSDETKHRHIISHLS